MKDLNIEELQKSLTVFKRILNSTGGGVCVADLDGRVSFINSIGAQMVGKTADELIGKSLYAIFGNSSSGRWNEQSDQNPLKEILNDKMICYVAEDGFEHADGTQFPVEYSCSPLKEDEKLVGVVITFRDIARRKRSEQALKKLSNVVEQTADSVVITDRDGTIEYVNPAFEKLTGYSRREAIGRNPRILKSGKHDKAFYEKLWHTLLNGNVYSGVFINKKKDGSIYYEDHTITPIMDEKGNITNFVSSGRDISERKKSEFALQVAHGKLKLQAGDLLRTNEGIRTLYKELKNSHEKLKEVQSQLIQAEKMQSIGQLATGVAHEIKNPLNILIQQIEYLSGIVTDVNPEVNATLQEMEKVIDRAATIISDLLDFARTKKTNMVPQLISTLFSHALEFAQHELKKKEICLVKKFDERDLKVCIDENLMQQVFVNLVINSVHAMQPKGTLSVRIFPRTFTMHEPFVGRRKTDIFAIGDDVIVVEIADTGVGISAENLPKIFDPFFTTKRDQGGTGMGLSMVKNIMDMHSAVITFESEANKGTKAVLMFKIQK